VTEGHGFRKEQKQQKLMRLGARAAQRKHGVTAAGYAAVKMQCPAASGQMGS